MLIVQTNRENLLYAVVDIETTGSYAQENGITEIAVFVTDGQNILEEYSSLVNPQGKIPRFVEVLTGISQEMVRDAPCFESIAPELFQLLHNKIFVAHNVNFDYSFLKCHLDKAGYQLNCRKLCTIRYARKMVPGLRGYGLDKICRHFNIEISGRHRAKGDAAATTTLLHLLIEKDLQGERHKMLNVKSSEQSLPPNISFHQIARLPKTPGIYYFLDKKGKVIYVGKAINIQKRVKSHFSNNSPKKQKQEFLKSIYEISFQETGTELMALILEDVEIKKYWPLQNRSQKRFEPAYGLYSFMDGRGYKRLFIDKKKKNVNALVTFFYPAEGYQLLRRLIREFSLCSSLCFLGKNCVEGCEGACCGKEEHEQYNKRLEEGIAKITEEAATFVLLDKGIHAENRSCIVFENGRFYGAGYISSEEHCCCFDDFKSKVSIYPDNEYLRALIRNYALDHPAKKLEIPLNT